MSPPKKREQSALTIDQQRSSLRWFPFDVPLVCPPFIESRLTTENNRNETLISSCPFCAKITWYARVFNSQQPNPPDDSTLKQEARDATAASSCTIVPRFSSYHPKAESRASPLIATPKVEPEPPTSRFFASPEKPKVPEYHLVAERRKQRRHFHNSRESKQNKKRIKKVTSNTVTHSS